MKVIPPEVPVNMTPLKTVPEKLASSRTVTIGINPTAVKKRMFAIYSTQLCAKQKVGKWVRQAAAARDSQTIAKTKRSKEDQV